MENKIFNDNHIITQSENDIKEICTPVFEKFNLQYFSYGRFYDDGRCVLLCTNKDVFHNHFKKQYKLTIQPEEKDAHKNKIYNLILVNNDSPDIITDEYNNFNHGTMIDLIKKHSGYYEMFCYVSKDASVHPVNQFLNSLNVIDDFSDEFMLRAQKIMRQAENQIIELPPSMLPKINDNESIKAITKKEHNIIYNDTKVFLSERQFECLSLISIAKSSKEIARSLNLSYRTVEKHIEIIKLKLNCKKRSDLSLVALKNNLDQHAISFIEKNNVDVR